MHLFEVPVVLLLSSFGLNGKVKVLLLGYYRVKQVLRCCKVLWLEREWRAG